MTTAKYEVYPSRDGWRWRLKSANGKIVASGEGYVRRSGALAGVQAHRRAARTARVDVLARPAPEGQKPQTVATV